MHPSPETHEPELWTLLKVVLLFPAVLGILACLIAAITYLAMNGLYSFNATSAIFLSCLILWLSSPLIVSFAYLICFFRDRRKLSEYEADANPRIQRPSRQEIHLRLIAGGRTHAIDKEDPAFTVQKPGKWDKAIGGHSSRRASPHSLVTR